MPPKTPKTNRTPDFNIDWDSDLPEEFQEAIREYNLQFGGRDRNLKLRTESSVDEYGSPFTLLTWVPRTNTTEKVEGQGSRSIDRPYAQFNLYHDTGSGVVGLTSHETSQMTFFAGSFDYWGDKEESVGVQRYKTDIDNFKDFLRQPYDFLKAPKAGTSPGRWAADFYNLTANQLRSMSGAAVMPQLTFYKSAKKVGDNPLTGKPIYEQQEWIRQVDDVDRHKMSLYLSDLDQQPYAPRHNFLFHVESRGANSINGFDFPSAKDNQRLLRNGSFLFGSGFSRMERMEGEVSVEGNKPLFGTPEHFVFLDTQAGFPEGGMYSSFAGYVGRGTRYSLGSGSQALSAETLRGMGIHEGALYGSQRPEHMSDDLTFYQGDTIGGKYRLDNNAYGLVTGVHSYDTGTVLDLFLLNPGAVREVKPGPGMKFVTSPTDRGNPLFQSLAQQLGNFPVENVATLPTKSPRLLDLAFRGYMALPAQEAFSWFTRVGESAGFSPLELSMMAKLQSRNVNGEFQQSLQFQTSPSDTLGGTKFHDFTMPLMHETARQWFKAQGREVTVPTPFSGELLAMMKAQNPEQFAKDYAPFLPEHAVLGFNNVYTLNLPATAYPVTTLTQDLPITTGGVANINAHLFNVLSRKNPEAFAELSARGQRGEYHDPGLNILRAQAANSGAGSVISTPIEGGMFQELYDQTIGKYQSVEIGAPVLLQKLAERTGGNFLSLGGVVLPPAEDLLRLSERARFNSEDRPEDDNFIAGVITALNFLGQGILSGNEIQSLAEKISASAMMGKAGKEGRGLSVPALGGAASSNPYLPHNVATANRSDLNHLINTMQIEPEKREAMFARLREGKAISGLLLMSEANESLAAQELQIYTIEGADKLWPGSARVRPARGGVAFSLLQAGEQIKDNDGDTYSVALLSGDPKLARNTGIDRSIGLQGDEVTSYMEKLFGSHKASRLLGQPFGEFFGGMYKQTSQYQQDLLFTDYSKGRMQNAWSFVENLGSFQAMMGEKFGFDLTGPTSDFANSMYQTAMDVDPSKSPATSWVEQYQKRFMLGNPKWGGQSGFKGREDEDEVGRFMRRGDVGSYSLRLLDRLLHMQMGANGDLKSSRDLYLGDNGPGFVHAISALLTPMALMDSPTATTQIELALRKRFMTLGKKSGVQEPGLMQDPDTMVAYLQAIAQAPFNRDEVKAFREFYTKGDLTNYIPGSNVLMDMAMGVATGHDNPASVGLGSQSVLTAFEFGVGASNTQRSFHKDPMGITGTSLDASYDAVTRARLSSSFRHAAPIDQEHLFPLAYSQEDSLLGERWLTQRLTRRQTDEPRSIVPIGEAYTPEGYLEGKHLPGFAQGGLAVAQLRQRGLLAFHFLDAFGPNSSDENLDTLAQLPGHAEIAATLGRNLNIPMRRDPLGEASIAAVLAHPTRITSAFNRDVHSWADQLTGKRATTDSVYGQYRIGTSVHELDDSVGNIEYPEIWADQVHVGAVLSWRQDTSPYLLHAAEKHNIPVFHVGKDESLDLISDYKGFTGKGGKYQPAGVVHAGEYVLSQEDVAAIAAGDGGYVLKKVEREVKKVSGDVAEYWKGGLVTNAEGYAAGGWTPPGAHPNTPIPPGIRLQSAINRLQAPVAGSAPPPFPAINANANAQGGLNVPGSAFNIPNLGGSDMYEIGFQGDNGAFASRQALMTPDEVQDYLQQFVGQITAGGARGADDLLKTGLNSEMFQKLIPRATGMLENYMGLSSAERANVSSAEYARMSEMAGNLQVVKGAVGALSAGQQGHLVQPGIKQLLGSVGETLGNWGLTGNDITLPGQADAQRRSMTEGHVSESFGEMGKFLTNLKNMDGLLERVNKGHEAYNKQVQGLVNIFDKTSSTLAYADQQLAAVGGNKALVSDSVRSILDTADSSGLRGFLSNNASAVGQARVGLMQASIAEQGLIYTSEGQRQDALQSALFSTGTSGRRARRELPDEAYEGGLDTGFGTITGRDNINAAGTFARLGGRARQLAYTGAHAMWWVGQPIQDSIGGYEASELGRGAALMQAGAADPTTPVTGTVGAAMARQSQIQQMQRQTGSALATAYSGVASGMARPMAQAMGILGPGLAADMVVSSLGLSEFAGPIAGIGIGTLAFANYASQIAGSPVESANARTNINQAWQGGLGSGILGSVANLGDTAAIAYQNVFRPDLAKLSAGLSTIRGNILDQDNQVAKVGVALQDLSNSPDQRARDDLSQMTNANQANMLQMYLLGDQEALGAYSQLRAKYETTGTSTGSGRHYAAPISYAQSIEQARKAAPGATEAERLGVAQGAWIDYTMSKYSLSDEQATDLVSQNIRYNPSGIASDNKAFSDQAALANLGYSSFGFGKSIAQSMGYSPGNDAVVNRFAQDATASILARGAGAPSMADELGFQIQRFTPINAARAQAGLDPFNPLAMGDSFGGDPVAMALQNGAWNTQSGTTPGNLSYNARRGDLYTESTAGILSAASTLAAKQMPLGGQAGAGAITQTARNQVISMGQGYQMASGYDMLLQQMQPSFSVTQRDAWTSPLQDMSQPMQNLTARMMQGDPWAATAMYNQTAGNQGARLMDTKTGYRQMTFSIDQVQYSQVQQTAAMFGQSQYLMSQDQLSGGVAGLQAQLTQNQYAQANLQYKSQQDMAQMSLQMMTGGATSLNKLGMTGGGDSYNGDGLKALQALMQSYGQTFNTGTGLGQWQIEDMQTLLGREQQNWGMSQEGRRLGISRQQYEVGTAFQRNEMNIQQEHAETQQGWQMQDLQFGRSVMDVQFGWQQEDYSRNIRYARGREKRDLMREQQRSTVMYAMEAGHEDTQENRLTQQAQWEKEEFDRQKVYFEQKVQWDGQLLQMSEQDHQKNVQWIQETRQLEDQSRLISRQFLLGQQQISIQLNQKFFDLQNTARLLSTNIDLVNQSMTALYNHFVAMINSGNALNPYANTGTPGAGPGGLPPVTGTAAPGGGGSGGNIGAFSVARPVAASSANWADQLVQNTTTMIAILTKIAQKDPALIQSVITGISAPTISLPIQAQARLPN